ncbi:hypothetical protein [Pseudokineococcus lusitanus]|uniref:Uncharacterized protein n=1 Tax=Pseudokineococcus lusitanus TaxID=763993 RepID=A0A3N1HLI1_9ACTN|nr:hypothetical protein [Pseudokineococcus lusitanus]ROP43364.1 hypothetical protein EDC03_1969 [Pseudokineococcus lusitanus]
MRPAARPAALALAGALLLGPAAASAASAAAPVTTTPVAVVAASPTAPATTPGGAATPAPGQPTSAPVARDDSGTGLVLPILVTTVVVLVAGGLAFAAGVQRRARDERRL